MLILTRKPGESLYIDHVKVTIVEIKGHQIRIGIDAPKEIRIYREEIYLQILEENKKAAEAAQSSESGLEGLTQAWTNRAPSKLGSPIGLVGGSAVKNAGSEASSSDKPKPTGLSSFNTSIGSIRSNSGNSGNRADPQVVVKKKRKKFEDE